MRRNLRRELRSQLRSSRERYRAFLEDYKKRRLDDEPEAGKGDATASSESKPKPKGLLRGKRREYVRDYSVSDNLVYGRHNATQAEVEDAAHRANAHEFIVKLPQKYETTIGERGVKLSGGQQQRLAIARAILASPQILILDEATSNLDTESEQLIQASMAELLAGRTTFVIAHRLSTIRRADLILLMEEGRVIERGTHEELMTARGKYHEMVVRQMESHRQGGDEILR